MITQNRSFVLLAAALAVPLLTACTTGRMQVRETHYFAVTNGDNTNYYRLNVDARTKLGVTQYRSGWFPARSVDQLFGKVSSDGGISELETRAKIEAAVNNRILSTTEAWLAEASLDGADTTKLHRLMSARRRVLAYPSMVGAPFPGSFEMEYNPARGVFLRYSDEKLVFVLSSNPDDVIGKIANFAESETSALTIQQLANTLASRSRADLANREAVESVRKRYGGLLSGQIGLALVAVKSDSTSKATALQQVTGLLSLLDNVP